MITNTFFFDNGYWTYGDEDTIMTKPKWAALMQYCFMQNTKVVEKEMFISIVTQKQLMEAIDEAPSKKRYKPVKNEIPEDFVPVVKKRKNYYKKKLKPEGYLTVKEKAAIKRAEKAKRKAMLNDDNRQSK